MDDTYWDLFWATGAPVFYLLHRREERDSVQAKTAWAGTAAAEV